MRQVLEDEEFPAGGNLPEANGAIFAAAGERLAVGREGDKTSFALVTEQFARLAAGVALIASPAWLRSRARRTVYALTNQRAIIWEPGWFGSNTVRNYTAAGLGHISRTERSDGSGDLVFEEFTTSAHHTDGGGNWETTRRGFMAIDGVREVEDLVRKTLLAAK